MSSVIVLLSMIAVVFTFTYIIGGQASMAFLYMLICSFFVSALLTVIVRKSLQITTKFPKVEVEKGKLVTVELTIKNRSFIPIPFIDIKFLKTPNLKLTGASTIRTSLGIFESKTIIVDYIAEIRGVTKFGIENLILRDFIGIFSFSLLKYINDKDIFSEIIIIPEIFNIKSTSRLLLKAVNSESQENSGEALANAISSSGEPGYEFREYSPGDPLRKIHWKLSAKRNKLMVRNDEGAGIQRKILILDPCILPVKKKKSAENSKLLSRILSRQSYIESEEETALVEEKTLEALLSIANTIVKLGIEVDVFIFEQEQWIQYKLEDIKAILELQYKLAVYEFINAEKFNFSNRIPEENIIEHLGRSSSLRGGEAILFTGFKDKVLSEAINKCLSLNISIDTVVMKAPSDDAGFATSIEDNLHIIDANKDLSEAFS